MGAAESLNCARWSVGSWLGHSCWLMGGSGRWAPVSALLSTLPLACSMCADAYATNGAATALVSIACRKSAAFIVWWRCCCCQHQCAAARGDCV
jgi:hypothetical protein